MENKGINKQINQSFFSDELKEVKTHKKEFLEQIELIMPWGELEELVRPCYYEGKRGNKPYDLELMLRIHFLQNLYNLSDEGTRNEVIDSRPFSDFCGVESSNQISDGDTIGGFNAMIEKQKKQDGGCYVSTVLFDDESEVLHGSVKLGDIPKMTDKDYTVRGCTALIDAIGAEQSTILETSISTLVTRMCRSIQCSLSQPMDRRTQATATQVSRSRR